MSASESPQYSLPLRNVSLSELSGLSATCGLFVLRGRTLTHSRRSSIPRVYLALIVFLNCLFACDEACVNLCTWESEVPSYTYTRVGAT